METAAERNIHAWNHSASRMARWLAIHSHLTAIRDNKERHWFNAVALMHDLWR